METNNNTNGIDQPAPERKSVVGKLWEVIVLLVGLTAGLVLSDLATLPVEQRGPFFPPDLPYFNPDPSIRVHIVLTTIEVALLVALVVVYLKVYTETKANFALGLVVVLSALFLRTVFSYPLILGTGVFILVPGLLTLFADVLTVSAYALFLYLSLE